MSGLHPGRLAITSTIDWQTDLSELAEGLLRHHRNAFHLIDRSAFEARVAELSARMPSLSDDDAIVGLRSIAAAIGDGHTFIVPPPRPRLPIEFCWFGDDLTVVRATRKHRDLIGQCLIAIGEIPVSEIYRRLQPVIPQAETDWYRLARSVELLREPEILGALGIGSQFHIRTDGGAERSIRLTPDNEALVAAPTAPLPMQRIDEPFWFTELPDRDAIYVQFRSYADLETTSAPLRQLLAEHRPRRLAIDLRQNGGGNFWAGRQWLLLPVQLLGLKAGELFVLVGRRTFSASMVNAIDFARETEALLVGEPIGARPYGYQENSWFTLSASGLRVSAACRLYRFGPENLAAWEPDRRIDMTHAEFVAGRDPVLDWALDA